MWWIGLLAACGSSSRDVPDGQRCVVDGDERWCAFDTTHLSWGALGGRDVHHQVPVGEPPAAGWPVAVLFQGSLHPAAMFWEAERDGAYGAWHQTATVHALLDAGWAVVTPNAQTGGRSFWNTNVAPWRFAWESAPDHALMEALLAAIDDGTFGPLDADRRAAAGISSGGYMTSRMALSYEGEFVALAIQSGGWATCSGLACVLPDTLPAGHPPTLFLHGEQDDVVPVGTMERYAEQLSDAGFGVDTIVDPDAGHAWIEAAPDAILAWFDDAAAR